MTEGNSVVIGHGGVLRLRRGQSGPGDSGGPALWSLQVRLADDGLLAETSIWLGPEGVEQSLADFFTELAANWRGWEGEKQWLGMEGGMVLSCTHDRVGHIQVAVELRHLSGASWTAHSVAVIEAGQLDTLAQDLRALLAAQAD